MSIIWVRPYLSGPPPGSVTPNGLARINSSDKQIYSRWTSNNIKSAEERLLFPCVSSKPRAHTQQSSQLFGNNYLSSDLAITIDHGVCQFGVAYWFKLLFIEFQIHFQHTTIRFSFICLMTFDRHNFTLSQNITIFIYKSRQDQSMICQKWRLLKER